jgi:SPP1 gp7 family putative phage head morphogenesis protein
MWDVTADPQLFEEALAWFRARVAVTPEEFRQLGEEARKRAFTVSGVNQLDLVNEVASALDKAVERGTDFAEFRELVGAKLEKAWGDKVLDPGWRLENIYRTNVQSAYSAGRLRQQQDPDVLRARPFWLYDSVLDSNTSAICRGLNGTLLPADHPLWQEIYPPNHFGGCRSGVRSLTRAAAERRGGATPEPTQKPDAAFAHAPGLNDYEPDLAKYPAELREAYERKRGAAP